MTIIEGVPILDRYDNELNPGDEVIVMRKDEYLVRAKIVKINRSIQYILWSEISKDYDINKKCWSILFTKGRQCNMYKL